MYPRELSWVKLKEYVEKGKGPLVVPVGSVEGHGVHLPIDTDILIAAFVADKLAERNNWISLPPITYTIAAPVRPGNVYVPSETFIDYLKSILTHFISFGQKEFILVMGHGGPDMKNSVINACNYLCEKHEVLIAVFHISQILKDLHLVDTSVDRHAGMWETSIIMAVDDSLIKNLNFYRKCKEPHKYGVVGDPLKASPSQGLKFIKAIIDYVENCFKSLTASKCYYNWLKSK